MNTTRSRTLFLALALALLGLVLLALAAPPARAAAPTIVRVKTSGTTTWPCGDQTNWSNACALQTALTRSVSPSEVWVAAGTYKPTMDTDRTATFRLRDGIALYGGFAGTETLRSQRNFTANVTTLSGDIGVQGNRSDNSYHVVTGSGVANTAVLDGFTVTGGDANDGGGGMANWTNSNPTLTNVSFISNTSYYDGGGMRNDASSPPLTNVTFSGNTAQVGGGMYNASSNPTIRNTILWGNTAPNGSQIFNGTGCNPSLYDSVVQFGCPAGSICDDNIRTADPRLGPFGYWGGSTQTVPLLAGSSALDGGDNLTCPPTDQRGVPRPRTVQDPCDIGAFEGILRFTHLPLIRR